jgi:hypothetical protein
MNHLVAKNTNANSKSTGWPALQQRYFLYSLALSCAGGEALWNGLTLAQKIAQSQPMPRPGNFQLRSCGGTGPVDPGTPPDYTDDDYVLQGVEVGGFPSTDTNLLRMRHHFDPVTKRIVLDGDEVNDPNDRWLINSRWYDSNPVGYSQSAYLPCRIQKFRIDPSRPRTHWRDNPVYNATINIRYR